MATAAVGWHRGDRVLVRIGTPVRRGSRLERISGLLLQERSIAQRPGWVTPAWWTCLVRQEVADLLEVPAGPQLIAALTRLADGPCPRRPAEVAAEVRPR